jgi:hypothetical protein
MTKPTLDRVKAELVAAKAKLRRILRLPGGAPREAFEQAVAEVLNARLAVEAASLSRSDPHHTAPADEPTTPAQRVLALTNGAVPKAKLIRQVSALVAKQAAGNGRGSPR